MHTNDPFKDVEEEREAVERFREEYELDPEDLPQALQGVSVTFPFQYVDGLGPCVFS